MVFEPSGIFAQAKAVRDNAFVASAVDEVTGANLFACGCLDFYALLVDLNARDFGFLAGHGAIVDGQVMKISVGILAEPVILIPSAGAELQAFLRIVSLARAVIDITEVALDAAGGGDVLGQALGVDQVLQLRETILLGEE